MAQKPIASPVDVVAHLTEQHEAIKALFIRGADIVDARLAEEHDAKVAPAVQLAERTAPTHPHAGVESGFVNFAVGPSASILDRARDLLRSRSA